MTRRGTSCIWKSLRHFGFGSARSLLGHQKQEDFYHLDDLMNCIVPPLAPLVMFFLELMAFAALLGSRFYLGLNAIWVALFKISDIGTPKMHQDNEGNEGNESMQ
ncbi:hypothetical protein V8B97DRAFT_1914112 [Scleroderma yunnanense]